MSQQLARAKAQRFKPSPRAMTAVTSEGVLLLDLHTDQFLGLNKTAATMWKLFSPGKTVEEVLGHMEQTYAVEPAQLRIDLVQFVGQMQERRLLEPCDRLSASPPSSTPLLTPTLDILKIFHLLPPCHFWEVLEAHVTLRWVDRALHRSGLEALAERLATLPAQRIVTREEHIVQRLISAVSVAASWQPFKAACTQALHSASCCATTTSWPIW
jgi:hypothetical protein